MGPRAPLPRGTNELTIGELREQARTASLVDRAGRLGAFLYYQRWAVSSAKSTLVFFALAAVSTWSIGSVAGSLVAVSSVVTYWFLMDAGRYLALNGTCRPAPGAWLPDAFFVTAAAIIAALSSGRSQAST